MNDYDDALQPLLVSTTPFDVGTIQNGNSESLKVVFRRPGKPFAVTTDKQPLAVTTTPLDFGTIQKGKSESLKVVIRNPNKQPVIYHPVILETKWLSLEKYDAVQLQPPSDKPGDQQDQLEINVTVDTSTLVAGSYTATLIFTADSEDSSASVHVPVLLTVSPAFDSNIAKEQSFTVSALKAGLSFVRYLSSSQTLPLAINNWDGQYAVKWTADTGGTNWLSLDRCEGVLQPFEQQTIWVTANTNSLNFGDYAATLTLNTEDTQPPAQIQVELHVDAIGDGDNGPKAPIVSPTSLDFSTVRIQASLQITSPLDQIGSVSLSMNNNGLTWLSFNTITGIILQPGQHYTVNVTIDSTGLSAGPYQTDLLPTFNFFPARAGSHSTPTPVPVSLTVP